MQDIVQKIKELFELYDEYGSEMPENEINFIELLLSKALDKGLTIEQLPPNYIQRVNDLHLKYSQLETFDSEEGDGSEVL